jgi:hypothetical protein
MLDQVCKPAFSPQELLKLTNSQLIARFMFLQKDRDDVKRLAEKTAELHAKSQQILFNVNERLGQKNCQLYKELNEAYSAAAEPAQKKMRLAFAELGRATSD